MIQNTTSTTNQNHHHTHGHIHKISSTQCHARVRNLQNLPLKDVLFLFRAGLWTDVSVRGCVPWLLQRHRSSCPSHTFTWVQQSYSRATLAVHSDLFNSKAAVSHPHTLLTKLVNGGHVRSSCTFTPHYTCSAFPGRRHSRFHIFNIRERGMAPHELVLVNSQIKLLPVTTLYYS